MIIHSRWMWVLNVWPQCEISCNFGDLFLSISACRSHQPECNAYANKWKKKQSNKLQRGWRIQKLRYLIEAKCTKCNIQSENCVQYITEHNRYVSVCIDMHIGGDNDCSIWCDKQTRTKENRNQTICKLKCKQIWMGFNRKHAFVCRLNCSTSSQCHAIN